MPSFKTIVKNTLPVLGVLMLINSVDALEPIADLVNGKKSFF